MSPVCSLDKSNYHFVKISDCMIFHPRFYIGLREGTVKILLEGEVLSGSWRGEVLPPDRKECSCGTAGLFVLRYCYNGIPEAGGQQRAERHGVMLLKAGT